MVAQYGIVELMSQRKIKIDKVVLENLYCKKNLSPYKIGEVFKCSFSTITNRLKEFNIPLKSPAAARMKYKKIDFDNNLENKAYMLGFRLGDLNVYKRSELSETIVVRCHTTQKSQVEVIESLFNKFGKVTTSFREPNHLTANCFLNRSFDFLLSKEKDSWSWIASEKKVAPAFIAGYTDAEGNFILNQGRARFKIDSYDYDILNWISGYLKDVGIDNKFQCTYKKGELNGNAFFNKDLWRLNINYAHAVSKFIKLIIPYMKHHKRIKDAKECLKNAELRIKKWNRQTYAISV
ncbi:MAG: hypothetical protein A3I92_00085 [Candidatus Yanofskybacteria bacterium RIFCSPLOWO2_02_FULL_43_10b]|uniref:Homing endonuclease LAGLIDADG domain-containing protein n=2 Tax=Candidatus Yanofskyibacteriota TaxID=1752733 RepID=A0A1F8H552_9BACT|nr:MAG: hypothetical protein A3I92_00085 [Candidatus Yanofskybacteria bacterium RIFCSPLOWO2_02_FULL_43_10b]